VRLGIVFTGVALLAGLAGTAMWLGQRAEIGTPAPAAIAPTALYASTFRDEAGGPQALGQFQGQILVINFWATWCAPCREEMPAFSRVHERWKSRGARFVGLSAEAPEAVRRFAAQVPVSYPLWTGGGEVDALSQRLGNRVGVLPHTVILDRAGAVLESKIGPFTEAELDERLTVYSSIGR
jgi:thiol-disulfide isomerase/thioredoxin